MKALVPLVGMIVGTVGRQPKTWDGGMRKPRAKPRKQETPCRSFILMHLIFFSSRMFRWRCHILHSSPISSTIPLSVPLPWCNIWAWSTWSCSFLCLTRDNPPLIAHLISSAIASMHPKINKYNVASPGTQGQINTTKTNWKQALKRVFKVNLEPSPLRKLPLAFHELVCNNNQLFGSFSRGYGEPIFNGSFNGRASRLKPAHNTQNIRDVSCIGVPFYRVPGKTTNHFILPM